MGAIVGYHAIEEFLKASNSTMPCGSFSDVKLLTAKRNKRIEAIRALARKKGIQIAPVSIKELDNLSGTRDHRGTVLLVGHPIDVVSENKTTGRVSKQVTLCKTQLDSLGTKSTALVLFLDGITDPHNLGAILRSCDLFALDLVILPKHRSAVPANTVLKTSAGASLYCPIVTVTNINAAVDTAKSNGFWIYGADTNGKNIDKCNLTGKVGLVIGSEGKGLSYLTREKCDQLISVPTSGHIDSFNASVATAICLYEIRRQQGFPYRPHIKSQ